MSRIFTPTPEAIAQAVSVLRAGGLVGFPSETVYGLGGDASQGDAVARIFAAKGRPNDHPVIVHVAPGADLTRWAREVPPLAQTLIDAFWPGPLTLVMARADGVLDAVTGGQDTVAVRCPSHPVAQALLVAFEGGLAGPSANRFGHVSPTTAQHVDGDFGSELTMILDGGPCQVGIESTIVDVTRDQPVLLRPGHISAQALEQALGQPVLTRAQAEAQIAARVQAEIRNDASGSSAAESADDAEQAALPRVSGALAAHYAPRTPLALVASDRLADVLAAEVAAGRRVGVWSVASLAPAGGTWLQAPTDPEAYAYELYAVLRRLDLLALDRLLIETPPAGPAWAGIHDRLGRAAVGSGAH
ncbi:threonylcarbamoyl-AMP synthase [Pigmentiphaga aceris]|uniref:Threonylcarbamoyl-AMP synthase n=1 Tax=Pigmentiphaga aceris TaxID=1940612 RepID=A0A5C0ASM7_9BURK|nr:L-threonylcarbamoyladenylate synthase [Pigmentiphaga aceris]QEI05279.1 threonylcarbamoyl-AMP synthase [Pigmentiphaga aceris]